MGSHEEEEARRLLAAEYEKSQFPTIAYRVQKGGYVVPQVIRAIVAALQQAQQPGAQAVYSIDADEAGIRARVADAITGALMFGAQGVNPPPADHWLTPFWEMARNESVPTPPKAANVTASEDYDRIDRFLSNNLGDQDYADYSAALDRIYTAPPPPLPEVSEADVEDCAHEYMATDTVPVGWKPQSWDIRRMRMALVRYRARLAARIGGA